MHSAQHPQTDSSRVATVIRLSLTRPRGSGKGHSEGRTLGCESAEQGTGDAKTGKETGLAAHPSEARGVETGTRVWLPNFWNLQPQAYFGHKPFGFHCISGIIHGLDES